MWKSLIDAADPVTNVETVWLHIKIYWMAMWKHTPYSKQIFKLGTNSAAEENYSLKHQKAITKY